jgi:hypothetical protein
MGGSTPYTADRAEAWLTKVKAQTDAAVDELRGATEPHVVSGCPVRHIREEREDGTDVYIGDVGLVRSSWTEVLDVEERVRFVAENNARAAGDPDIAWHVGCTASSRLTSSRLTAPQTTSPRATKDED